ncbi:MAG: hypothetical protein K6G88_04545 [Lachnospiraceae bacterium]|nr:hypothetical protein [Lachnospiraceae bacterium]
MTVKDRLVIIRLIELANRINSVKSKAESEGKKEGNKEIKELVQKKDYELGKVGTSLRM